MGNLRIRPYEDIKNKGMYNLQADIPEITYNYIGKRGVRRIDGYAKASGKAVYTRDVQVPGMLYAKVMRSPYAHARILSMDTSKAESLPGVVAVLRYDDPEIKGRKLNGSVGGPDRMAGQFSGFALKPESVILAEEAWFEHQAVGAVVAAESEDIAKEALRLLLFWTRRRPLRRMRRSFCLAPKATSSVISGENSLNSEMWKRASRRRIRSLSSKPREGHTSGQALRCPVFSPAGRKTGWSCGIMCNSLIRSSCF